MLQKVQKYMTELNMVSPKDTLLVGVSGGADSICLLHVLYALSREMDFSLEVIHVEHGIRGEESLKDAAFVEDICQRMQLSCHSVSVDVPAFCKEKGVGIEEGARLLRYEAFARLAKEKPAKVALAHHMEDNAETILFQMARGSSLTGLCGIAPMRKDENDVLYIRPLLCVHRQEIEDFLQSHGQEYCVDSTNKELEYSRNYLRNVVLKDLAKVNEQAITHINETASQLAEIKDFIEKEIETHWDEVVTEKEEELLLQVKQLSKLHLALQKEIGYKAIVKVAGSKKDICMVHVMDLLNLCNNQSGKELHLPYGILAQKEYEVVRLYKKKQDAQMERESLVLSEELLSRCKNEKETIYFPLNENGETIEIRVFEYSSNFSEISKNSYTKWMDYDKIKQGFCIRNRNTGDYFICDEFGHRKKVKQYFIDEKIPVDKRNSMWILAQDKEVLWLIGGRMSEHVKITEQTKNVIEVGYQGGN